MNSETEENHKKNEKGKLYFFIKNPHFRINFFGLFIILMGIFFYLNPTPLNIKISLTMIFVGCLLFILLAKPFIPKSINDSQITKNSFAIKKTKFLLSEKITLLIIGWALFSFFITNDADLEMFFVLIFIGLFVIKQLTDELTTLDLKKRMSIFIIALLIICITIIAQKILTF